MPSAQQPARPPVDTFAVLPDPGQADTLEALVERLRWLKVWAGDPSYESIKDRVNVAWTAAGRPAGELPGKTTIVDCFRPGRRRLNSDLVVAVVQALHPDAGYANQWQQALQVLSGRTRAAAQVRVQDRLPPDLPGFTGRLPEVDHLLRALNRGRRNGDAVVVCAIGGMAGVGKTQLAIHAGHLIAQEQPFDRVLFVNLRGFHPGAAQPPADPAAVLDGFLRLLGVPGTQIPHDLSARTAVYREHLAGSHTLVVLDNAAGLDQVHPLLTETPGCPVLVTSRRSLTGLHPATHLTVDVFSPDEAVAFLAIAAPRIPVGRDSNAAARIAGRCGHLPLALGLVAGHMQATPGWTLTDHADRLDERHRDRHLDAGVALALDLSYHHLPTDQQRLLRLLALHPGQDLDAYAAAALTGVDLPTAGTQLLRLCADHLLQPAAPGRYAFHDLVRAYAASRARDEDPPLVRRAALTRLFDHYLATAAAAMDALAPAEAHRRPRIPAPGSPVPVLTDSDTARTWLDAARPTLVTIAAHTAAHGWASHTTRLSITLYRYLNGGHPSDALTIHAHARHAAEHIGDLAAQAHAHNGIGTAHLQLSQYRTATAHLRRALDLFRQADDRPSQARVLTNLCLVDTWLCRYQSAARHADDALTLWRLVGDPTGEARALINLGVLEKRQGQYRTAADHHTQALALCRQTGDRGAEATALFSLADVEVWLGWYVRAADHLHQARALYRQLGNRGGEAWTLDSLGTLHTRLNQPAQAIEYHQQALAVFRATGDSNSVACALNGLGEATSAAGRPADALAHHTAAHTLAANVGDREQQARAHAGLGRIHHALANPARAYEHYQQALNIYTDLGMPQADQIHLWIRS